MYRIRRGEERGHFDHGWLNSYHTFSFADYYDPNHMGFRSLRVINEDWVQPGQGFGMHPHRDMEIVTYVLEGELEHGDSLGNGEVLRAGEFQRMTAGTGIMHREFNPSREKPVHLYQIWLLPREKGLKPTYDQRAFPVGDQRGKFRIVASPDGMDDSLVIQQDARISLASLKAGEKTDYSLGTNRHAWLQVLRGSVNIAGNQLKAGDAVAVSNESSLVIDAEKDSELMLFDMA